MRDEHLKSSLRASIVTVLGKEKNFGKPLWVQEGSEYKLTEDGREAAKEGGVKVAGESKKKQRKD